MTDTANKREFTRAPAHVHAALITRGGSELLGTVIDLSLNGVFMRCEETLPEGTECELVLTLGGTERPITAVVRGAVVRSGLAGIAVHIDEVVGVDSYHHLRSLVLHNTADPAQAEAEFLSHTGLKPRTQSGAS